VAEIKSHTALRGVAALLVVIFHFRSILAPVIDLDAHTLFFAHGYLWVDCFFMLSGFILCYVYGEMPGKTSGGALHFLKARFARIYPLHIATLMALVCWQIFIPQITRQSPHLGNWSTFWLNVLDIHAWGFLDAYDWNFPSWSISIEFAAYLTFPLICVGLVRLRTTTLILLALSLPIGLSIGRDHWEQTALLHGLPMFFAGILMFQFRPAFAAKNLVAIQIITALCLVAAMHFGEDMISTACFAVLIFSSQTDRIKMVGSRPFLALGNWSYSIYMLHIPARIIIGMIFGAKLGPVSLFVVLLAATVSLGALSYRFFEMPIRKQIMSLKRQPLRAQTS